MVEKYIFERWAAVAHETSKIKVLSWQSNGCDNSGEFLPTGTNTAGADYKATLDTPRGIWENVPIEVKLAPLHGFMTLKQHDVAAYRREEAAILFVMPVLPGVDVRMSNGMTLDQRLDLLEATRLEWGIMWPDVVHRVASMATEPQKCFGGKPGVRIHRESYSQFFRLYPLRRKSA